MPLRPLLILQTGNPPKAVSARHGGFDAMVQAQAGLAPERTAVVKVYAGEKPADPEQYAAVIITGSPANVTDRDAWSLETAAWLRRAVAADVPVLGICYGHQLMAEALGGQVDFNPAGRESGTQTVTCTADAASDLLASALPSTFPAHFIHEQSVLQPPPGAVVLARNGHDAHQMLRFAPQAWGVQFHPEFDAPIMRTYLEVMAERLAHEGADVAALQAGVADTPAATAVLRAFVSAYGSEPALADGAGADDAR